MAGRIATFAAKKALNREMDKYKSRKPAAHRDDDPFFEAIKLPNGKVKKVRKQIPEWIPEHDAKRLEKAKKWAYRWDLGLFDFVGIRFGWGSVFGFIPGIGDGIDFLVALYIWSLCSFGVHAPMKTRTRVSMLGMVVFDLLIGLIPFIGDLADAEFKCNAKNVAKFEKKLLKYYGPRGMSLEQAEQSRLEDMNDDAELKGTHDERDEGGRDHRRSEKPSRESRKSNGGRRWYGGNDRSHQHDLEMGTKSSTRGVDRA